MTKRMTEAEIDQTMAEIDGINSAAGHRLEDPYIRQLLRKSIAGEITGDEYRQLAIEHILTKKYEDL